MQHIQFISLAGVAVTVAALGSPDCKRLNSLVMGSGLFAGSSVSELLADAGVRKKFKPVLDLEADKRKKIPGCY